MCYKDIPVIHGHRKQRFCHRQSNPDNLIPIKTNFSTPSSYTFGLWNCQSAVNKTEFIQGLVNLSDIQALALTETWIRPENTVTPAALSIDSTFSHTPRPIGRGGGTGVLLSKYWKFTKLSPLSNITTFEYHAITITAPIKLVMVVIYRPPGSQLTNFVVELDMLLSAIPDDDTPLIVMGDMNIQTDKALAVDFLSLLSSFDLKQTTTPPTHKAGNTLDLIFTRNCSTEDLTVTPLHLSDHFFIQFKATLPEQA